MLSTCCTRTQLTCLLNLQEPNVCTNLLSMSIMCSTWGSSNVSCLIFLVMRTVWVLQTSQSLIRLQALKLNRDMCKGCEGREESDEAGVMSLCVWYLLGATQTEPPSKQAHTPKHTFACIDRSYKRAEVSRHMSEFLSLCLSQSICLCLVQYSPSPIRGPRVIHISATPLPWPALTLWAFFVSICLPFTWHT